jgi:peptidoglycan/xylan/chitin deacetylase (PgdA/CDA1 family)
LAWGWRYARAPKPEVVAQLKARRGRRNLDIILELCERYDVPITWAMVGHLFLESCRRCGPLKHPEIPRVPYFENEFWSYRSGDWFDGDPASEGPSEPEWWAWYGPDLVRSILAGRAAHEIGCHTFSHVVLTDASCPPEVATVELGRCQEAASRFGLTLRSFVFPGNLLGNRASLSATGFAAYRHRSSFELDAPRRDTFGLWQVPEGVSLENPFASWSAAQHVKSLQRYIDVAIEHGLLCGLWFHPETDPRNVDEVFPRIFAYIASRRSELWIATMDDLARWLDAQHPAVL